MPTGAGKSFTVVSFIKKFQKHFKFVLAVRTRGLVYQLEEDLKAFELDYSVYMAGEKEDLSKRIQLCSKDTLQSRNSYPFKDEENIVFIYDEADESPGWQKEVIEEYKSDRFFYLGQTATPYKKLDHFDIAIQPITAEELRKRGVLVDYKYFIEKQLDFSDVEIKNGIFNEAQLLRKLDNPKQIASSFSQWLRFGEDRQTLVFCINKNHGKNVCEYINNYYGKPLAIYCDAGTSRADRKKAIDGFKKGTYRFLINIRLFTRGTNIIEIGAILDLCSTLSINHHIQKLGRGSRKNPIYKDCIIIDVANNCLNNNHFYYEHKINLKGKYKKSRESLNDCSMRVCPKCCRAGMSEDFGAKNICPYCGHQLPKIVKPKLSKYMEEKILMSESSPEKIEQIKMIRDFKKMLWITKNTGRKYHGDIAKRKTKERMLKKYGVNKCLKVAKSIGLTRADIDSFKPIEPYVPLGGMEI